MTDQSAVIKFNITNPPSLNKLWVQILAANGKPIRTRSREYKEWAITAGWELRSQAVGNEPIACRFDVLIEVPISRRDTDNWPKPILDILESVGIVTNDGNQNKVLLSPVSRDNCQVTLTTLPEMGDIRKPARKRGDPRKTRTLSATEKKKTALKKRLAEFARRNGASSKS